MFNSFHCFKNNNTINIINIFMFSNKITTKVARAEDQSLIKQVPINFAP